jgi:copper transporter 1
MPFRLSADVPKAAIAMITSMVAYLLQGSIYPLSHGIPNNELSMLTVMTISIGYFMSILAGTFLGEPVIGRYVHSDDH